LFEEIELPLEPVLSQMEMNGITIDIPYLDKLSKELKSTLEDIESKVYELAEEILIYLHQNNSVRSCSKNLIWIKRNHEKQKQDGVQML